MVENDLILEIENYAKKENIPIMQKDGITFLLNYIKENNINNILEIGTAIGYSAIKMALLNNDIKVTSIEKDINRYQEAIKNITKANLEDRITLIFDDATNVTLKDKYDLIFIDAAKGKNKTFFEKFSTSLNDKGTIITDNMHFHGYVNMDDDLIPSKNIKSLVNKIRAYTLFLKENEVYITTIYDIGDGIAISKKR